jgi:anti-sigma factor RsiW
MPMQLDDETLQRYHDGDLSPVEERAVRARVEQDPDAQRRLKELEQLGSLIRLAAEEMGRKVDSDALFASIEAGIQKEAELGAGARLRLIVGEWSARRKHVLLPLAAAAAAAAVAVIKLPARHAGDSETARSVQQREVVRVADSTQAVHGSHIEDVDFGSNTGTVFEIENEGVMTAVVWIADEEEVGP